MHTQHMYMHTTHEHTTHVQAYAYTHITHRHTTYSHVYTIYVHATTHAQTCT